jgi:hypothetical protein
MKRLIFFLIFAFVATLTFAQREYEITEEEETMSKGQQNALVMELPGVSKKIAEDEWKAFIKGYKGKTKQTRKTGEWFSDDAKIPTISGNTVDVYATFSEDKGQNNTTLSVWFDLGGAFLVSEKHEDGFGGSVQLLKMYGYQLDKRLAKDELSGQEKNMKDLEKELKNLEKDNENYHKKIEDAKALIAKMEENIAQNLVDQERKKAEIEAQLKNVDQARESYKKF